MSGSPLLAAPQRRPVVYALLLACMALSPLAGCGRAREAADPVRDDPVPVTVEIVTPAEHRPELRLSAVLRGMREVVLVARSGGGVVARPVALGDTVAAGDTLLVVDDRAARAGLAQAEAAAAAAAAAARQAARTLRRKEGLAGRDHVAEAEIEAAQLAEEAAAAESRAAAARVELARVALEDTRSLAPFRGVIAARYVEPGGTVAPGTPLFRLVAVDSLEAVVGVVDRERDGIAPGQAVRAVLDARPDEPVAGRISRVGPEADPVTGTFPVELVFPNRAGRLAPGMAAEVVLVRDVATERILIPAAAVTEQFGRRVVFRVAEGRARLVLPVLGGRIGGRLAVLEGLAPGDSLITGGLAGLVDGRRVRAGGGASPP